MGWSGKGFARRMHVKPETVSRWERGHQAMNATAEQLLRVYVSATARPVADCEGWDERRTAEPAPLRMYCGARTWSLAA